MNTTNTNVMSEIGNEIILRPRFKFEVELSEELLLKRFEQTETKDFVVSRVTHHVFIRIPKAAQHFWSPQLHLETLPIDDKKTLLKGLFGPNPSIWTLFMFAHFAVVCGFIIFGVWAYVNWSINKDFIMQIAGMILMVLTWFVLYFMGRMGKAAGKDEMHQLYRYMEQTIGRS